MTWIRRMEIDFHRPVGADQEITITSFVREFHGPDAMIECTMTDAAGTTVATCLMVVAHVDARTRRATDWPAEHEALFFEAERLIREDPCSARMPRRPRAAYLPAMTQDTSGLAPEAPATQSSSVRADPAVGAHRRARPCPLRRRGVSAPASWQRERTHAATVESVCRSEGRGKPRTAWALRHRGRPVVRPSPMPTAPSACPAP